MSTRRLAGLAGLLGALASSRASNACDLHVGAIDAGAWKGAIGELRPRLAEATCKVVVVERTADGALVVITLDDGRTAVRNVATPSELGPTVMAVLEGIAATPASAVEVGPSAAATEPAPSSVAASSNVATPKLTDPSVGPPARLTLGLSLYTGFRAGGPGDYATAIFGLETALALDRWSLGVYGQWESGYASSRLPDTVHLSGFSTGIFVARSIPLGAIVAGILEAHVGLGVLHARGETSLGESGTVEHDQAEARVGVAAGIVLPRESRLRLRGLLGLEFVPTRVADPDRDESVPINQPTPRWAVTAVLAGDLDVP